MKIFTISTTKDVFCTLPPSEQKKVMKDAIENIINVKKKMGDKVQFYGEVGSGRVISIGEHPSIEDYVQCLQGSSTRASFSNVETHVLIEYDLKAFQSLADSLK
jgi:hypothetical protein